MIKDVYVSFATAALLDSKGFDGEARCGYDVITIEKPYPHRTIPKPTQQVVLKWLREVHQIYISINCCYDNSIYYEFDIFRIKDNKYEYISGTGPEEETNDWNDDWPVDYTYEKACENAIKYCLIHLI